MPRSDWQKVAAALRESADGPTADQVKLAKNVGLALDPSTPRPVAAALLRRHMRDSLGLPEPKPATDGQLEYLSSLIEQTGSAQPAEIHGRDIADAWLEVMHARRAASYLEDLRPEPGDVLALEPQLFDRERLRELASIGDDGQLYFRGAAGQRARPHQVRIFARTSDPGYRTALFKARQQMAGRVSRPELVGSGRIAELADWRVSGRPELAAVLALEDALGSAADERPMQRVIEKYPEILAPLVTGNYGIYVKPQVAFGNQYVADFLIAARTSKGLLWTLVELESPTAPLAIADGQASKQLRKAMKQIADWREWLGNNSDYARRSARGDGLGLLGIRNDAHALIIIGRGAVTEEPDPMRIRAEHEQRIAIHTYDWLVRACHRVHSIGALDAELERHISYDDLMRVLIPPSTKDIPSFPLDFANLLADNLPSEPPS